jgi:hypothetical protein
LVIDGSDEEREKAGFQGAGPSRKCSIRSARLSADAPPPRFWRILVSNQLADSFRPDLVRAQRALCDHHRLPYTATLPDRTVAINLDGDRYPISGVRESDDPRYDDLSGWWIWNGERVDSQASFSALTWDAIHAADLADCCPEALLYLALPAGWRFRIAPGREEIWNDARFLES